MCIVGGSNILLFKVPKIINEYYHNRYPTILCAVYITVIPSFVHFSPTTSLVVYANPPTHPRHDAVTDLHAHEYTAVHTRGQHPFSPLHISLYYIHVYCRWFEYTTIRYLTPPMISRLHALFYLKFGPKNRPRLMHGSNFSTQAPVK